MTIFSQISLVLVLLVAFQNCSDRKSNLFGVSSSEDQKQSKETEPVPDPVEVPRSLPKPQIPEDQVAVFGNPMALFVNCGTHYQDSKQNMFDLNPGFVRVFVNDWHRQVAIDRAIACMDELQAEKRIFLLQFTKIYEDDNLNDFETVLQLFIDRFGEKIKFWQIGNEHDHDMSLNFPVGLEQSEGFVERLNHIQSFLRERSPGSQLTLSLTSKVFDPEKPDRLEKFLSLRRAMTRNFSSENLFLDIHYHHDFEDAEGIVTPITRLLNRFQSYNPSFILTENNTHSGQAMRRDSEGDVLKVLHFQTEEMQASYGLRTVALALAKGAKHTTFGYPIDRPNFGNPLWVDHHFALNGLFYNPEKEYAGGESRTGPKRSAFAYWLLSSLFSQQDLEHPESPYIVTMDHNRASGLYSVRFQPWLGKGRGFRLVWYKGYTEEEREKAIPFDFDAEISAVINASETGTGAQWPPASLDEFIDTFDILKASPGPPGELRLKEADTYIIFDKEIGSL